MDSEENKTLKKILDITRENHKMLSRIQAARRREAFFRFIYWIIIIGIAITVYMYIQPYIESAGNVMREAGMILESVSEAVDQFPTKPEN